MKKLFLLILLAIGFANANAVVITISQARTMATGTTVTVRGIVSNGAEFGGSLRYMQDGTAGIGAYSTTLSSVNRGDSIEVTGTISPYNNLMEIAVTSFTVITTGNSPHAPIVLTMINGYAEQYEGQLVRFNAASFVSTGTFGASSANYNVMDGTLASAQYRVNAASNIASTPIPTGSVSLVGIMGQYTTTYQLLPRDLNDIILPGNPPVFTSALIQSNLTTSSFDIDFTTQNPGSTIIQYGLTPALGSVVSSATLTTNHHITVNGLVNGQCYYVRGVSVSSTNDTSYSGKQVMADVSISSQSIKVYFDKPVNTTVAHGTNATYLNAIAPDTLIAYMNRAKFTMDISIYNMDNINGVVSAINAAYNRGVTVRVIGDGANMNTTAWNSLTIPAANKWLSPTSAAYGICHNKFMIIDANSNNANDCVLWTGSMNWTDDQMKLDANNIIIFQDQSIARAYEIEFNEMFVQHLFGPDKFTANGDNTAHEFVIGGNRVQLFFSPTDDPDSRIKAAAATVNHDLELALYVFTRNNIAYLIHDSISAKGAFAGAILEDTTNGTTVYNSISGVMPGSIFIDGHSWLMHNKFMLVDANDPSSDPMVLTGSHNWSTSAQFSNDENTVIVHSADIANQYYQAWTQLYTDDGGTLLPTWLGVETNDNMMMSNVYPNPANDLVNVYFSLNSAAQGSLNIYNINGQLVQSVNGQFNAGMNLQQLDIRSLSAGIYMLQLTAGSKTKTMKIVVGE